MTPPSNLAARPGDTAAGADECGPRVLVAEPGGRSGGMTHRRPSGSEGGIEHGTALTQGQVGEPGSDLACLQTRSMVTQENLVVFPLDSQQNKSEVQASYLLFLCFPSSPTQDENLFFTMFTWHL